MVARLGATFFRFWGTDEREVAMGRKSVDKPLKRRIESGQILRQDVTRRLAELAFGKVNDCVRLVLENDVKQTC